MPTLNDAFNELQSINSHLQTLHADNGSIIAGQAITYRIFRTFQNGRLLSD